MFAQEGMKQPRFIPFLSGRGARLLFKKGGQP